MPIFFWQRVPALKLLQTKVCSLIPQCYQGTEVKSVTLPWELRDYQQSLTKMQSGFNVKAEAALLKKFPPPKHTHVVETRPFIIVDKAGEIRLWHLPSAISDRLQRIVARATSELHSKAPALFKVGNGPATRCDPSLFQTSVADLWGYGTACLSYCWFQQGHDVSPSDWVALNISDVPSVSLTRTPARQAVVSNTGGRFWNTLTA